MLSNNNYTTEILDLQGAIIKNVETAANKLTVHVEMPLKEHICPVCGCKTSRVHDYRVRHIKDLSVAGRSLTLAYRRRRYRCTGCGKCFPEKNSFVARRRQMTLRFTSKIIESLSNERSFSSVARDKGISVSSVIRIFDAVEMPHPNGLPEVFAIDEFKGNTGAQKYQCILTDPAHGRVLDILPDRRSSHLIEYLKCYDKKKRDKVKFFVSDMWRPYADMADTYFKNATQIVDKYHFVRQCVWAFEAVRKREQKRLGGKKYRKLLKHSKKLLTKRGTKLTTDERELVEAMLYLSHELRQAYHLKERFYEVLDAKEPKVSAKLMGAWILEAQNSGLIEYENCGNTFIAWGKGILNSFKYGYTNGFTEGCNNKIKVLKRNAYGYRNFRRFRNRILFMFYWRDANKARHKSI